MANTPPLSTASSLSEAASVSADVPTQLYLRSMLASPAANLRSSAQRVALVEAVFGDARLAADAPDDPPLLRQLDTRAHILVATCSTALPLDDAYAADAILALLALVAARWHILLDRMEKSGAPSVVISIMKQWRHRPSVITRALAALRAFTVTDSMRKRVMFDGGVDLVLQLMTVYRDNHLVQDRGASVVANVAFGCTHRKRRITRQGAITNIIEGMSAFPNDEHIQLRGALTIRNLTHDAQVNQYIAGNEGAVEAVARTLLRFRGSSTNPELRFQCVLALESLCREDERNRQRLVDIDQSASIHRNQHSIIRTSVSRSTDVETINEDGDVVVEEEEVLQDTTSAFKHGAALCPGNSSLKLIASMSTSSSSMWEQHSPVDENNPGNEEDDAPLDIPKRSVIRAVVHAMRRDPDDVLLLQTALSLLTLIALHRSEVQTRIGELGGVQVAIAAMRRHATERVLISKACALIRCLCLQEANRTRVTSGLLVLISAAQEHRKDGDVVREVASALSNAVFENEKNRNWVVNKGAVEALVRAMNACGGRDALALEACICALRNFIDSSYSGAIVAADIGALRAAVEALDATKAAASTGQCIVQEQAVLFLVDISRLAPETMDEMKRIDAADWIENALAKLPESNYPELHASGDKLIGSLMVGEKSMVRKKSDKTKPLFPDAVGNRHYSRGIFRGFLLPRRSTSKRNVLPSKIKGQLAKNISITAEESGRKSKRLSARFLRSALIS